MRFYQNPTTGPEKDWFLIWTSYFKSNLKKYIYVMQVMNWKDPSLLPRKASWRTLACIARPLFQLDTNMIRCESNNCTLHESSQIWKTAHCPKSFRVVQDEKWWNLDGRWEHQQACMYSTKMYCIHTKNCPHLMENCHFQSAWDRLPKISWATKKIRITFHHTGRLIGILAMVNYNPFI